jgi:hypothetical protein
VGRITCDQEWNVVLINQNARIRAADLERVAVICRTQRPAKKQTNNKNVQMACSIRHVI